MLFDPLTGDHCCAEAASWNTVLFFVSEVKYFEHELLVTVCELRVCRANACLAVRLLVSLTGAFKAHTEVAVAVDKASPRPRWRNRMDGNNQVICVTTVA